MTLTLRPYQRDAIDSLYSFFEAGGDNPIVCIPVGGGKTAVMATFMREAIENWPGTKILLLSHVKELLAQSAATLKRVWPEAPATIYSAGLGSKDLSGDIVIAGIQSIWKRAYEFKHAIDLVLIDECHLLSNNDTSSYRKFLADLAVVSGGMPKVIGLSATPWRENSGPLHKGENALFSDVAYEIGMGELIEQGYLAPLRCKHTETQLDVTGVHTRAGDYVPSELQAAVDKDDVNAAIVAELLERGRDRKSWLLFGVGTAHCDRLCSLIRAAGIDAACVFGETPAAVRDQRVADFRAGKLRCLLTVQALGTGFDAPAIDLIGLARPTKSRGLYVQMMGRGVRLAPGKTDCLVLDWSGTVARLGPVDMVRGRERKKGSSDEAGTPPMKVCPDCEEEMLAAARECPCCGHEFPPPDPMGALSDRAIQSAILASEMVPEWLEVKGVEFRRHNKPGSPPSMRVDYRVGLNRYSEWVCPMHAGGARRAAARWFAARGCPELPESIEQALEWAPFLAVPSHIKVYPDGKFWRIGAVRFDQEQAAA